MKKENTKETIEENLEDSNEEDGLDIKTLRHAHKFMAKEKEEAINRKLAVEIKAAVLLALSLLTMYFRLQFLTPVIGGVGHLLSRVSFVLSALSALISMGLLTTNEYHVFDANTMINQEEISESMILDSEEKFLFSSIRTNQIITLDHTKKLRNKAALIKLGNWMSMISLSILAFLML